MFFEIHSEFQFFLKNHQKNHIYTSTLNKKVIFIQKNHLLDSFIAIYAEKCKGFH